MRKILLLPAAAAMLLSSCTNTELDGTWKSEIIADNDGVNTRTERVVWQIKGGDVQETRLVNIESEQNDERVSVVCESVVEGALQLKDGSVSIAYDAESLKLKVDVISTLSGEEEAKISAALGAAQRQRYIESEKTPIVHAGAALSGDTLTLTYCGHDGVKFCRK